ncbi:MAG: sigma-54-dependent Fis family transcriptional regulator [Bacteroidales bacterium]|nr:sigma-54-dependent Fis family transcriptional regulator [Bacteroidales bacterium]
MNTKPGKILVIDDDRDILLTTRIVLKKQFGLIETEADPEMILQQLENELFDIILLDMNFSAGATSGKEGMKWLREIRKKDESAHVIMMTAYGDIDLAVKAMKEGAADFIVKPWDNQKLMATVINAYRLSQSKREIIELRRKQELLHQDLDQEFSEIIGRSDRMKVVFDTISKVAQTDANVLILGENGTGKELIARALHRESERAQEIFVSVDLGAIPETLFESELFGHVKGAFTDAGEDRSGRFEVASGGTLFLDEIGNLSLPLQSKLLSVVQNRVINRVGASRETPINIRLICATNMPLYRMVREKSFREDLLYRINTVEIKVPPLRERRSDIPLFTDHFTRLFARKYNKTGISLHQDVYQKLDTYSWPGNIRELQHVIERAIILNDKDILKPVDFLIMHETSHSTDLVGFRMEDVEKQTIQQVLVKYRYNISKAADELGMARTTLYRKMTKYGIS